MKQSILLLLCLSMAALYSSTTAETMNLQEDQLKDPFLPSCCTRSKTVTTAVKCEFDRFCQDYHPVATAEAVSRISSITDLTFQISIASKKQGPVTDADLQKIADSLNSTSIKSLTLIMGSLKKVTGTGLATLAGLNAIAQQTLESLNVDFQITRMTDDSAKTIGSNLEKFTKLNALSINVKNIFHQPFTSNGVAAIFSGISTLKGLTDLSFYTAGLNKAKAVDTADLNSIAKDLDVLRPQLTKFTYEFSGSNITYADAKEMLTSIAGLYNVSTMTLVLNDNKLNDNTMIEIGGLFAVSKFTKLKVLNTNFADNDLTSKGLLLAVSLLNAANYQGKWILNLANQGDDVKNIDPSQYASVLACVKNKNILAGDILVKETSIYMQRFNKVTDYSVSVDTKLCPNGGLKLQTHITGGPFNTYSHVCRACSK
jgi:hypothetical protein